MKIPTPDFIRNAELNEHEAALLKCAVKGEKCQLFDKEKADASYAALKGAESGKPKTERRSDVTLWNLAIREQAAADNAPTIRADLIRFLVRGGNDAHPVDPYGVSLTGARITGTLTLEGCRDLHTLVLDACRFDKAPDLLDAAGQMISLDGSHLQRLDADGLTTSGGVFLRNGCEVQGAVRLLGAQIGGDLDCTGGRFLGQDTAGNALHADRMATSGGVFLRDGFEARGAARLLGARIRGNLDCVGGRFAGDEVACHLQAARITGILFWRKLAETPKGLVKLDSAEVGVLVDDIESWPRDNVILDGFRYGRISGAPTSHVARTD